MMSETEHVSASKQSTFSGCLVRFFWMGMGNAALAILGMTIAEQSWWPPTWRDAAFWAVVGALAVARLLDIRLLDGRTVDGAPASAGDLHRYLVALVAAAAGLWALAHFVARAGWMR
jgi:hypothetical protein